MASSSQGLTNGNGDATHQRHYRMRDGSTVVPTLDITFLNRGLAIREPIPLASLKDFHGDPLLLEERPISGSMLRDIFHVLTSRALWYLIGRGIVTFGKGINMKQYIAQIVANLPEGAPLRAAFLQGGRFMRGQIENKWNGMLHPPLSYLGNAFQHRTVDGSFNSVLHPHLGKAGTPYAKTVPAKARQLGAQPDPGDIFDRLMAREVNGARVSQSGLSVWLVYHATIIIHDIFRTNERDSNISDSSSYLDLSPLYGYDEETTSKVRLGRLGLLRPDTFAENRLLRQPPGVCTYLVMYNRYHNYCARRLLLINENGKFSIPEKFNHESQDFALTKYQEYHYEMKDFAHRYLQHNKEEHRQDTSGKVDFKEALLKAQEERLQALKRFDRENFEHTIFHSPDLAEIKAGDPNAVEKREKQEQAKCRKEEYEAWKASHGNPDNANVRRLKLFEDAFKAEYDAAWKKLDNDLYGTARLITCGLYVNISIHDYLRALMGFHQWNTTFTLDPRLEVDKKNGKEGLQRGAGNQVSVEFNLLYRFHCAISPDDEAWMNRLIQGTYGKILIKLGEAKDPDGNKITKEEDIGKWDPASMTSTQFNQINQVLKKFEIEKYMADPSRMLPEHQTFFDLDNKPLPRDPTTGLFDDSQLINIVTTKMDEPIAQFGPRNVPRALKPIEVTGILQARKWEIGTLNDFREFFGMKRHETFESISKDPEVKQALMDLYENVDKVEFYPGVFCEGGTTEATARDCDPGPQIADSTLWAAIFSDAVTLVRSDRFYTVDWNTNTLTSWGMAEVSPDNSTLKSSLFHRLLQRSFPDWYKGNNLHFFHPFYTTETNMKYAQAQGYGEAFNLPKFDPKKPEEVKKVLPGVIEMSTPTKPNSVYTLTQDLKRGNIKTPVTVVVKTHAAAEDILKKSTGRFIASSWMDKYSVPPVIVSLLQRSLDVGSTKGGKLYMDLGIDVMGDERENISAYFQEVTTRVVQQKKNTFQKGDETRNIDPVYQIDAVRDLAIPVITSFFTDFLGFSHLIIESGGTKYSTHEMYHHLVNIQSYISYHVDETKKWKRREAFKKSIKLLLDLTINEGHVKQARAWWPLWRSEDKSTGGYMKELGYRIAQKLLGKGSIAKSTEEAAAIHLLLALESVYNEVLTFASALMYVFNSSNNAAVWKFMSAEERKIQEELHAKIASDHLTRTSKTNHYQALSKHERRVIQPKAGLITWEDIQKVAFSELDESHKDHEIMHFVLEAQRMQVKLPVVRKIYSQEPFKLPESDFEFRSGDTVIVDCHTAEGTFHPYCDDEFCAEQLHTHKDPDAYLSYMGGFSRENLNFEAKYIPVLGISSMFKVLGQMKFLRQGHDSQGRLKAINNNPSYMNLADRISPQDLQEKLPVLKDLAAKKDAENKGNPNHVPQSFDVLPDSYAFLAPEWDETLPFPNSLKVRFDGYGTGVWEYGDNSDQSHGIDSLYQPDGPSAHAGSWGVKSCPCAEGNCVCTKSLLERVAHLEDKQSDFVRVHAHSYGKGNHMLESLGTPFSGCGM